MPEDEYVWLPREDVLSFEETAQLTDLFGEMGVDRIRLTGGEPLLRRDLPSLVAQLAERPWLKDLALWLRDKKRSRFLLTAPPLRLPGAVGSPATPVATV